MFRQTHYVDTLTTKGIPCEDTGISRVRKTKTGNEQVEVLVKMPERSAHGYCSEILTTRFVPKNLLKPV
jgi:hypothetical protein